MRCVKNLLPKLHEAKYHVSVKQDMDELDLTAAESKATYEEIKKQVAEHNDGLKVREFSGGVTREELDEIERQEKENLGKG